MTNQEYKNFNQGNVNYQLTGRPILKELTDGGINLADIMFKNYFLNIQNDKSKELVYVGRKTK